MIEGETRGSRAPSVEIPPEAPNFSLKKALSWVFVLYCVALLLFR